VLDQIEDVLSRDGVLAPGNRRLCRKLIDVRAGNKRFLSGSGQHHRPHAVVVLQRQDDAPEFVERLCIESIQQLGPVDRDGRDAGINLDEQVLRGEGKCAGRHSRIPREETET
jgi:hypothetical protein